MEISLSNSNWKLKGFWPWVPMLRNSVETGLDLMGVTDWIPATVPGGVHYDLYRAGYINDPYKDQNSLLCEWVENRWWVYKTEFSKPDVTGEKFEIVCKGLDYEAMIYMNGRFLGEHKGMYHPAIFDITDIMNDERDSIELIIVLKHVPDEMGQIGKTSMTFTQKSRFNYKWDFSTRLVNIGIWDDVVIRVHQSHSLRDVYLRSDVSGNDGLVSITADVQVNVAVEGKLSCQVELLDPQGDRVGEKGIPIHGGNGGSLHVTFRVRDPQLWYPNGYGAQPLYQVRMKLMCGEKVLDEKTHSIGIRSLRYMRNEGSPEDALPYTFVINGKKIYIKGVNITPLDHLYGNVTRAKYEWMIRLAKHANINMIRVWGGGIIEKPEFYELCDQYGILVWQEFIQSSSGIDNIPSKHPEFLELLKQTAISALKDRRNYTCLSVWSGGNELMDETKAPSTYEDENIAMLKTLVENYDPQRLFLPTSASGPVEHITKKKGVSHDVHGWWKYQGNPEHYELYGEADHLFHSEFGVDGLSSMKSIRKFLSEPHLYPVSMDDNLTWRHHGEWWDTYDRDLQIFGSLPDLPTFVECSQWMQAEGLRFILEANRRRKFNNSGSIIWQLNEPWPNVSCTNLVDYYGETKMAFYATRKAFSINHVSLDYRSLYHPPGSKFESDIYIHCSGDPVQVHVVAQVLDSRGHQLFTQEYTGKTQEDIALKIGKLGFNVPRTEDQLFFVRLKLKVGDTDTEHANLYIFSTCKEAVYAPVMHMDGARLEVEALEDWSVQDSLGTEYTRRYRITNTGSRVALHVYPETADSQFWIISDGAYESLFPGESQILSITCLRKTREVFADPGEGKHTELPEIFIKSFQHRHHPVLVQ